MNLQYRYLFDARFLNTLDRIGSKSLPVKTSIQLAKIIKDIQDEQKVVFPIRDGILKEYGVSGFSNGLPIMEDVNKTDEFNNKVLELMNSEFELSVKEKVVLPETIELSAQEILSIEPIVSI